MEKFNKIKDRGLRIAATVSSHHTGAFAAQAAYFFVLSLIPIFMLLLTMVQFTPVTKADVMEAVLPVFPSTVSPMIESIVNQVYMTSGTIIPLTILVALWSAGKGVLSVTYGLNCIYQNTETRNYFYLRARACMYTFLFLVAIMLSLVLSVFGNSISVVVYEHAPLISKAIHKIIPVSYTFEDLFHTSASDFLLGSGVQVSSKSWCGRKDDSSETIAGRILYSLRLDGTVLYLFCLFGYF